MTFIVYWYPLDQYRYSYALYLFIARNIHFTKNWYFIWDINCLDFFKSADMQTYYNNRPIISRQFLGKKRNWIEPIVIICVSFGKKRKKFVYRFLNLLHYHYFSIFPLWFAIEYPQLNLHIAYESNKTYRKDVFDCYFMIYIIHRYWLDKYI